MSNPRVPSPPPVVALDEPVDRQLAMQDTQMPENGPAPVGTRVGSYELITLLGEGGVAHVYLALHVSLGRRCALKMIKPQYAGHDEVVRRFFSEARTVTALQHPHLVEITDYGVAGTGQPFFVMELLEGIPLSDLINSPEPVPLLRALRIMDQVCEALGVVHAAGIVHRDIKPENIYLISGDDGEDFVKLLDFGIAKLRESYADLPAHHTNPGLLMGTPAYMAPEQVDSSVADHRADIYAFGVLLYQLVAGRHPFLSPAEWKEGLVGDLLRRLWTVDPLPPSVFSGGVYPGLARLDQLALACLAKDPADRPQSVETVRERLAAVRSALGPYDYDAPQTWHAWRKWAVTLSVLALVAGATVSLVHGGWWARLSAAAAFMTGRSKPVRVEPVLPSLAAPLDAAASSQPDGRPDTEGDAVSADDAQDAVPTSDALLSTELSTETGADAETEPDAEASAVASESPERRLPKSSTRPVAGQPPTSAADTELSEDARRALDRLDRSMRQSSGPADAPAHNEPPQPRESEVPSRQQRPPQPPAKDTSAEEVVRPPPWVDPSLRLPNWADR